MPVKGKVSVLRKKKSGHKNVSLVFKKLNLFIYFCEMFDIVCILFLKQRRNADSWGQ